MAYPEGSPADKLLNLPVKGGGNAEVVAGREHARAGTLMIYKDYVEPMQWRNLNVFNKECVIMFALPRGRGSDDGKV